MQSSLQIGYESSLLSKTPATLSLSHQFFLNMINSCFTPSILVFRLSVILKFLKKVFKNHSKISQAIQPFHLCEISWALILKASSKYYPPQIPYLDETYNINGVPVLINRLENASLNLQISLCPILSPISPLINTLIMAAHHQFLRSLMGCRPILSQTNFLKSGPYGVHVSNLKHYLTEYSKTCGICNTLRLNTYRQPLHSNLTNVANPKYCRLFKKNVPV